MRALTCRSYRLNVCMWCLAEHGEPRGAILDERLVSSLPASTRLEGFQSVDLSQVGNALWFTG